MEADKSVCPACDGEGEWLDEDDDDGVAICEDCGGTGQLADCDEPAEPADSERSAQPSGIEVLEEQIQAAQELLDRGFVPSELLESGKAVLAGVTR